VQQNLPEEIYINDENNSEKKLTRPTIRSIPNYLCQLLPTGRALLRRASLLGLGVALHFYTRFWSTLYLGFA
jgi:hypothetical protein